MFWTDRLKHADADADGSWVLSYGDLVSLLLVVFVMIAAMGEVKAGDRFGRISDGVRQAFGFSGTAVADASAVVASPRPQTLLERLEQEGFRRESSVQLIGPDDEMLASCDVIVGDRTITLRIAGHAAFAPHSASLELGGEKALRRVAQYLSGGICRLEVRGHAEPGPLPPSVPFRDGMDLSYARGRCVADVLEDSGVARERMFITAWAETDPLNGGSAAGESGQIEPGPLPEGADRRIEIVVHAEG